MAEIIMTIKGPSGRTLNLYKDGKYKRQAIAIKKFMEVEKEWLKSRESTQSSQTTAQS